MITLQMQTKHQTKQMHGHRHIKSILKISYTVFQLIYFIIGLFLSILSISIFFKEKSLLKIPYKALFYSQIFSIFLLVLSVVGFATIKSHKKLQIFVYIALSLFVMNLQALIALEIPLLVDKTESWANERWEIFSKGQRKFIQDSLGCCGFLKEGDRSVGKCEGSGCAGVIKKVAIGLGDFLVGFWVFLFFMMSLNICILLILKMKKRKLKRSEKNRTEK